jgi:hypothetical protein
MIEIVESTTVSRVWAGHPVRFDLLTHGEQQFVAFYDAERRMTIAARTLGQATWTLFQPPGEWLEHRRRLSTVLGWDSHNSLRLAVDGCEQIHLCGNMHVDPLIYFRTTCPLDITSLMAVNRMVGSEEAQCTYPLFMDGPNGELIFRYRAGRSGNGVDYYNVYDVETERWRRLLDTPLLDGQGQMNAYAREPRAGPDGRYHMVWMWRDTGDCATNHDLSYACSPDLVHWQAGDGSPLDLPITIESGATVDPAQPGEGLINMVQSLGFDSQGRPVVAYTKYAESGPSQAYCARLERGRWRIVQVSDWTYRWAFSGNGSIPADIQLSEVQVRADGGLSLPYWHIHEGSGCWVLDEKMLEPVETLAPSPERLPEALARVESRVPGMQVRSMVGRGQGPNPELRYILRWETLCSNRDQPRTTAPPPSELRVYTVRRPAIASSRVLPPVSDRARSGDRP